MANPTISKNSTDNSIRKVTWTLVTATPNGSWVKFNEYRDRCISFQGTFGGATVGLYGSNDGGTTEFLLNDPTGADITTTSAAMFQVLESPELVRAKLSAVGVGANLTAIMVVGRGR